MLYIDYFVCLNRCYTNSVKDSKRTGVLFLNETFTFLK